MTESEVAQLKRDVAEMALRCATAGREYDELYDLLRKMETALEEFRHRLEEEEAAEAFAERAWSGNS